MIVELTASAEVDQSVIYAKQFYIRLPISYVLKPRERIFQTVLKLLDYRNLRSRSNSIRKRFNIPKEKIVYWHCSVTGSRLSWLFNKEEHI